MYQQNHSWDWSFWTEFVLISGSRSQSCKGATNGSYLYGGAPFSVSGGIYPGGTGSSYGTYPQSYNQDYQYSTPFQTSAASTSAYYGHHPASSASSYYYNPSPSTSSTTTPIAYGSGSNPPIPGIFQIMHYIHIPKIYTRTFYTGHI
jgi:hypothetical protein